MDKYVKKEIIESVNSIKSKIKEMRNHDSDADTALKKIFKPITDPLQDLVRLEKGVRYKKQHKNISEKSDLFENSNSTTSDEIYDDANTEIDSLDESSDISRTSFEDNVKIDKNSQEIEPMEVSISKEDITDIYENIRIPFGIRHENKMFKMGNSDVKFSVICDPTNKKQMHIITIDERAYELTPGLKELLLRKKPNLTIISDKDKLTYKDILYCTNAHKRNFNPSDQIKGDKSIKYKEIIKPLFADQLLNEMHPKVGGKLPTLKKYNRNTDLVYWDDPNELIERLKLLVASKNAGNTNHDNEIISIIEELKEANIIRQ